MVIRGMLSSTVLSFAKDWKKKQTTQRLLNSLTMAI